jgi:tRNA dimethylallyltransferase
LLGPTASGKSEIAMRLAEKYGAEIISVDSMQVYQGMDIGTAKPSVEERARVRHHLVDVVEPEEDFTVADAQRIGRQVIEQGSVPVLLVGGTGLAFRAIVDPLEFPARDPDHRRQLEAQPLETIRARLLEVDPDAGAHLDLDNPRRVVRAVEVYDVTGLTPSARAATAKARAVREYRPLLPFHAVGLDSGDALEQRVAARLVAMFDDGLLEEVRVLAPRLGRAASQAVGYKELLGVVDGRVSVADGRKAVEAATLAVATSQRTFFRRDPRIHWLEWDPDPAVLTERVERELMAWIS